MALWLQHTEVGTSANPQIADLFADLRWKNWNLPQIRKAIGTVAYSAVKSVWEVDDLIS